MPDTIECVLGRLFESVENLKLDLAELKSDQKELKNDHKEIKKFIDDQKSFHKYIWAFVAIMGSLVYFARDVFEFITKAKHGFVE